MTRRRRTVSARPANEALPSAGPASFGHIVRLLRARRRLSIRRAAALAGLAPSYLSRIERGKVSPPPEKTTARIARALGSDPDDLVALSARIPEEVTGMLARRPRLMSDLIRRADHYSDDQLERLCRALAGENPPQ